MTKRNTNDRGGLIITNIGELLDVTYLLPSTDKSDDYIPKMNQINDEAEHGELSKRMIGITKWAIMNATVGQRNETLFRLGTFARDIGEDSESIVLKVNAMINSPLPDKDINQILRSIKK